jgi:secreted Zn-dependent insulinase-like peptidase
MNQVEKATANPDHDFSKFGTGNKETLDIIPKVHLPFALYFLIFFFLFCGLVLRIRDVYPGF